MGYGYAAQNVDPETTAKASGREVPVKPKHGVNIARFVKGKDVAHARAYLEDVIAKRRSIPFVTHNRHVKHRRDISGPGKFPVNAAKAFLSILKDAEANAEYKGLDPEEMYVWHAVCHRGRPLYGTMPRAYGRATQWQKTTSHIEIILKESSGEDAGERTAVSAEERKKAARKRKVEKAKASTTEKEE